MYHRARSALLLAMPPFATILRTIQGKGQWWEQWQQKTFGSAEPMESFSQFADRVYRSGHPSEVGQLAIAYGMAVDTSNLFRYLDSVQRWVISNDEYASSPEGIECMLLQGKCLADIGQPQRCWSAWRRALLYAELRVSIHTGLYLLGTGIKTTRASIATILLLIMVTAFGGRFSQVTGSRA
jgi:hypothetical protein